MLPTPTSETTSPASAELRNTSTDYDLNSGPAKQIWRNLTQKLSPFDRKRYFEGYISEEIRNRSAKIQKLLLESATPGPLRCYLEEQKDLIIRNRRRFSSSDYGLVSNEILVIERKVRAAFSLYGSMFPSEIWTCCKRSCFAGILIDPSNLEIVMKLKKMHTTAKMLHDEIGDVQDLVETRRRGVGCSNVAFRTLSREEREKEEGRIGTDRQKRIRSVWDFVGLQLPYLYGKGEASDRFPTLQRKLCTEAVRLLLCVSRSFLYHRKKLGSSPKGANDHVVKSLIDTIGLRQRQHRRDGKRTGYPSIADMKTYECGCDESCFSGVPEWRLERLYKDFQKRSMLVGPRRKEHQFLLGSMFCPLTNSTVMQCNKSISALFTVSEGLVSSIRRNLDRICADSDLEDHPLRDGWEKLGYTHRNHPILRYDAEVRTRIEQHLNMILRADPAGGAGVNVCRVYSPEINTHEKLRSLLSGLLKADKELSSLGSMPREDESQTLGEPQGENGKERDIALRMSSSTMQRVVNNYLTTRNLRIAFQQTDHNACPNCKAMQYASTQYHYEHKRLKMKLDALICRKRNVPGEGPTEDEIETLRLEVKLKREQEEHTTEELRSHSERDCAIRRAIKVISDHFCKVENKYITKGNFNASCPQWNRYANHAIITHQDDMTKVDLPYFVRSASADITRWRFDVNAHVSAVNGDAIVFSHEQGSGAKNASSVVEEILLDHIVRCRGESIKVIVSDNASVGKNWLTTIALPQYIVDQGLADVVLVVFLENNHGKWLADMLFGQLQTRRRRTTLLGVDDLLKEFEAIDRKNGTVRGFALNPLSSIDFSEVFASLGYETKPPKDFGFTRRNIHFAGACRAGAKGKLESDVLEILGSALPDEPGMVRICCNPPNSKPQSELLYDQRYFDVPACSLAEARQLVLATPQPPGVQRMDVVASDSDSTGALVVPLDKNYSPHGNGVVSNRTADHVGFNGYRFRNLPAFPELSNVSSDLVRRAWPPGLIERNELGVKMVQLIPGTESVKCAPENWVMRKPVYHMDCPRTGPKARYPPKNLLNAKYMKGPREMYVWVPAATYEEPPFPIIRGTAAYSAMKKLSLCHTDKNRSVHVLEVLRVTFEEMGRKIEGCDQWLQKRVTVPSPNALTKYRSDLQVYIEREKGHPASTITLRQSFKKDPQTRETVDRILSERGVPGNGKQRTAVFNELFSKAELTPGALNHHEYEVRKDCERVAKEMAIFKEKQRKFDEERGLLPKASPTRYVGSNES